MQLWMQAAAQRVSTLFPHHKQQHLNLGFLHNQSLERILYVWAIRHPASGYVQGINDLVTPFYQVFLSSYIGSYSYC